MKTIYYTLLLSLLCGCYSVSRIQDATVVTIHKSILTEKEISFLTYSGSEYRLMILQMDSDYIRGTGKRRTVPAGEWINFDGAVAIKDIDVLTYEESDFGRSILINAAILTMIIKGFQAADGPSQPTLELVFPPSGSSCPFIYSWTGDHYRLEGEAFGIALGKAREMTTTTVLNHLNCNREELRFKITNERPETHFINYIRLNAVEVNPQATVIADNHQNLWPVMSQQPPNAATDQHGKSILQEIIQADELYWRSKPEQLDIAGEFNESLELTFDRPSHQENGSLIIRAINTHFANIAFEKVFAFLGDQALQFIHAMESDSELIDLLEEWTEESSLSVAIWNGTAWQPIDMLYPEANVIPFSRLLRIGIPAGVGDKIRLRLSSLAGMWNIDAVSMDWSDVNVLQKREIPLKTLSGSYSIQQADLIREMDDRYAVLLPPQQIELLFPKQTPSRNKKMWYALDVGGYLHGWLPPQSGPSESPFSKLAALSPDRIGFLIFLLKHKTLLLPPLYKEWKRQMLN